MDQHPNSVLCVLTARGLPTVLQDGGTQAWVLDALRARKCAYVVCVQNRDTTDDWGHASAPHHAAFVVGKLDKLTPSTHPGCEGRWHVSFSGYARIEIPDAWPGYRNPVFYTDLDFFGIDPATLHFQDMPDIVEAVSYVPPLTMKAAKRGLASHLGIAPDQIEITIRA